MTARVRRGRRIITCAVCGKNTPTRHPATDRCAEHRQPITARSKHDLDQWLQAGGAA